MAKIAEIIPLIVSYASYYERTLSDEVVEMYAQDLQEFSIDDLKRAYNAYRRDPKNTRYPLPAQIIGIISPKTNSRAAATDLVSKLCTAAKKRDYTWPGYPNFRQEFLEELGEVAWNVVQKRGGWVEFCNDYWSSNEGTFEAQLRDHIEFTWDAHRSGDLLPMHKLPEPEFSKKLSLAEQAEQLVGTERFKELVQRKGDENV